MSESARAESSVDEHERRIADMESAVPQLLEVVSRLQGVAEEQAAIIAALIPACARLTELVNTNGLAGNELARAVVALEERVAAMEPYVADYRIRNTRMR